MLFNAYVDLLIVVVCKKKLRIRLTDNWQIICFTLVFYFYFILWYCTKVEIIREWNSPNFTAYPQIRHTCALCTSKFVALWMVWCHISVAGFVAGQNGERNQCSFNYAFPGTIIAAVPILYFYAVFSCTLVLLVVWYLYF